MSQPWFRARAGSPLDISARLAYKRAMRFVRLSVALGLLLVPVCALAQQPELEWDWRSQEVIGRTDASVHNTSKLTEAQRTALIDDLVQRLEKPMTEAGYEPDRIREIASTTRVRFIDLGDGKPVLFATSVGMEGGCDALGNCPFWVFRRDGDAFLSLLDTTGVSYTIQPTSSEGLSDLVFMNHVSAKESHLKLYRASGGKYVEAGCYKALWPAPSDDPNHVSDPQIVTCTGELPETKPAEPEGKQEPAVPNSEAAQPKPEATEPQEAPKPDVTPAPENPPATKSEPPPTSEANPDASQAPPPQPDAQQQPAPEQKPDAPADEPPPAPDSASPSSQPPSADAQQPSPEQKQEPSPQPDTSQSEPDAPQPKNPPPDAGLQPAPPQR